MMPGQDCSNVPPPKGSSEVGLLPVHRQRKANGDWKICFGRSRLDPDY